MDYSEPIHGALWRPRLWFGCHQAPLAYCGALACCSVIVGLATHNLLWMVLGILFISASVAVLRWIARLDPHFFQVAPRYLKHARYYPAQGSVHAPLQPARRHQR